MCVVEDGGRVGDLPMPFPRRSALAVAASLLPESLEKLMTRRDLA